MPSFKISLAAARVNAKMTQEEVAKVLQISKKTLINWEKGVIIPNAASVHVLAEIYNISEDYIFLPTKST